jgi:hypothetical protein
MNQRRRLSAHLSPAWPLSIALLSLSLAITSTAPARSQPANSDAVDAARLLETIKQEIQEARKLKTRPILNIKSVTVTLQTIAQQSADAGIKLVVPILPISLTGTVDHQVTQTVALSFKPTGAIDVSTSSTLGLAEAIKSAKLAAQAAVSSDPKFLLDNFTYDAEFVLRSDGKGSFSFWVFDVGGVISRSAKQHIQVQLSLADTQ